ncbi:MAG TPA: prephenate dehydratase [Saprospiraceae bacterium]|nr:prephenate dehydratase [Saprospiraceae bacterium]MCB9272179.1 prephenate dehydratase [Lewinellaceae bacterium]HPG08647.1 prephenate dehydratase [Saprospiraceae bacterium]HPQ98044.1 prephenate dehydratase [Saprospiraceae bacterium]HRV84404.1 prephenate dehydratase [Saprospiraceae bacterium]
MKRVSIQGYPGAFHEIAARTYYPAEQIQVIPCDTFEEVVERTESHEDCDIGMMAIENTISGSLLSNYMLLYTSKLNIIGEVYLRIKQNLLTLPGVKTEDLKEVYSHPIAIAQCREFFESLPNIKIIEHIDTALSARMVKEWGKPEVGAIASTLAADMYGLNILKRSIETNKQNYTRFLVLDRKPRKQEFLYNKISICFTVSHEIGSLHKVLSILAFHHANLTKIQSVPLLGKPFEYLFFADFILEDRNHMKYALDSIKPFTGRMKILGNYPKGAYYGN